MIIYQKVEFDAAHRLYGYEGNCSNLHGHTWTVDVWINSDDLDQCGMLMDYRMIKEYFKRELDHRTLINFDDPLFEILRSVAIDVLGIDGNPTAEVLAQKIMRDLGACKVRVHESSNNYAEVSE